MLWKSRIQGGSDSPHYAILVRKALDYNFWYFCDIWEGGGGGVTRSIISQIKKKNSYLNRQSDKLISIKNNFNECPMSIIDLVDPETLMSTKWNSYIFS